MNNIYITGTPNSFCPTELWTMEWNYTVCKPEHGYTVSISITSRVSGVKDVYPFKFREQYLQNTQSKLPTI